MLIGGWLAVQAILEKGPTITISFETGEGLEAGKTKIKFKDVDIGVVKSVVLSPDHKRVIATAELSQGRDEHAASTTRASGSCARAFPAAPCRASARCCPARIIGMDIGTQTKDAARLRRPRSAAGVRERRARARVRAEERQTWARSMSARRCIFRRLQVGQVTSYELDADGKGVTLHVFVNAPYDKYVKGDTRFWQASGIDVSLDTSGVKVNTESLVSILIGGLAFQSAPDSIDIAEAAARTRVRALRRPRRGDEAP